MVKNTATTNTAAMQKELCGTVAAITTPAVAPTVLATILVRARRIEAPADPAITRNAVKATTRLCSMPIHLAINPAASAATTACTASAVVGRSAHFRHRPSERSDGAAGALDSGGRGVSVVSFANDTACKTDSTTSSTASKAMAEVSAASPFGGISLLVVDASDDVW